MKTTPDVIKRWVPYALWDFAGIQAWLNEQAAAGYALVAWSNFSFIGRVSFCRDPIVTRARYRLDPIIERIGGYEEDRRRESFEEAGWHYIASVGKMYAVYRCNDPAVPDLYNDTESLFIAMKNNMRWAWTSLFLTVLWIVILFRDELKMLLFEPSEFLLELIFRAEVLVPLYALMLICVLLLALTQIGDFRGLRRVRAALERGQWPEPGRRNYPILCHNIILDIVLVVFIGLLIYSGTSNTSDYRRLMSQEEWTFPHVTLEETLVPGATILVETEEDDFFFPDRFEDSLLVPEQYSVDQEGRGALGDERQNMEVYQNYLRARSEGIAETIYRCRTDSPEQEALTYPGLDELSRFTYNYEGEIRPQIVYIGRLDEIVFAIRCTGFSDAEGALDLLVDRIIEDRA